MSKARMAKQIVENGILSDLITTFQCRPYTIVEIHSYVNGLRFRGIGEARCGKNDYQKFQVAEYDVRCLMII